MTDMTPEVPLSKPLRIMQVQGIAWVVKFLVVIFAFAGFAMAKSLIVSKLLAGAFAALFLIVTVVGILVISARAARICSEIEAEEE